jgi:hypothetical protein
MNNILESSPYLKENFCITKFSWLVLFKEILAVYSEN